MDIRRLRYFIAAAEDQNLHRAAARLHIVQPALSKQIAALEDELECMLFERTQGRMYLTPAGQQFLLDARQILRDLQAAKERAQQTAAGQRGTLRIAFRETAGRSQIVSQSFSEFRREFPEIELILSQQNSPAQCDALRAGDLDVGFIYLSSRHDHGLKNVPLTTDQFFLSLHRSHPLAEKKRLHLRDLIDCSFIWLARSKNAYYSDALLRDCIAGGLTPKIIQESDSDATSLNLVAVGMGISFVVSSQAESSIPDVVLKPVIEITSHLTLAAAWNPKTSNALTNNFISIVRRMKSAHGRTPS